MILLDTATVIWWLAGDRRLAAAARDAITSAETAYVSAVSIWEMAIKRARGRLMAPPDVADRLLDEGFQPLAVEWEHARVAGELPRHHDDPFDRVLVAQAIVERLVIVTSDRRIAGYGVPVVGTWSRR